MSQIRKSVILCFLRNDLRIHDNEVLFRAHEACVKRKINYLLPIYVFDEQQVNLNLHMLEHESVDQNIKAETWNFGFDKCGKHRLRFLIESVADLQSNLKQKGSNLFVSRGKPECEIGRLIEKLKSTNVDVDSVYLQKEVTYEETKVEESIEKSISPVPLKFFWGSTLYHPDDLPFLQRNEFPTVFTQFRKKVESDRDVLVRKLFDIPNKFPPVPPLDSFGNIPTIDYHHDSRSAFPFKGGESAAIERLNDYFFTKDLLKSYKETRNGLIGADYSSKFSPWLANGSLSPRFIYHKVQDYEKNRISNDSTYWLIFELLWRDFFKNLGDHLGNSIFHLNGKEGDVEPLRNRSNDFGARNQNFKRNENKRRTIPAGVQVQWKVNKQLFEKWRDGETGIPWVDANMRELKETGFMSNRGRQNVASFLSKDLGLDWRLGAEWFESQLIDHDVCSNYGNWQYASGVGVDPRENRRFNMIKQAKDYDPQGAYVKMWCPELQNVPILNVHDPWSMTLIQQNSVACIIGKDYPGPIVQRPEWKRHDSTRRNVEKERKQNRPEKIKRY